jgi:hypothetical protein
MVRSDMVGKGLLPALEARARPRPFSYIEQVIFHRQLLADLALYLSMLRATTLLVKCFCVWEGSTSDVEIHDRCALEQNRVFLHPWHRRELAERFSFHRQRNSQIKMRSVFGMVADVCGNASQQGERCNGLLDDGDLDRNGQRV